MAALRLIDVLLELPQNASVTSRPPKECRVFHVVQSTNTLQIRRALEDAGVKSGYTVRRESDTSYLQRGDDKIEAYDIDSSQLGITVDPGQSLPKARVSPRGISIADLELAIPDCATVEPGRERHDSGSTSWTAEWWVDGCGASELASKLHETLVGHGYRSGGIWTPPEGGIRHWRVEAHLPSSLVQAGIMENGRLHLKVRVIR